jgi:exodeoxyribonuclease-5
MNLSNDQQQSLNKILKWITKSNQPYLTLGGYAGTGKTTLISVLRNKLHDLDEKKKVSFCSFTGKAARVLNDTLKQTGAIFPKDDVGTIHSLIYSPMVNSSEEIIGWQRKEELKTDLIIVDEASMIDKNIWMDLLSFKIPILAVGDHGQLPPINGSFNLMDNPMIRLEQIHRQAEGNPIIELSILARQGKEIEPGNYGDGVRKYDRKTEEAREIMLETLEAYDEDTMVLCGYNTTRTKLNNFVRQNKGYESERPEVGDRVICLRNNHEKQIFNGMLGTIESMERVIDEKYFAKILMDGESSPFKGEIYAEQFGNKESMNFTKDRRKSKDVDLFDFGYALTVHKSQGSQAKRVVLFEERFAKMNDVEWKRWLYTAITRAQEELIIFG